MSDDDQQPTGQGTDGEPSRPKPNRFTSAEAAVIIALYLARRRELLIAELREVDRLLNLPQTVPVRKK